tara:strand:- start:801 stop:1040 length:240 start_codon:yes stop_codon:yes gene_type:complete
LDEKIVMEKVSNIFKVVFGDDKLMINSNSSSNNVVGWDSLNHIYLIVAIEKEFNIKFTTELIMTWENVGEMVRYIAKNV